MAFVTGANGGIGMAITRRLLHLDLTVVAIDKQTDHLLVSSAQLYYVSFREDVCVCDIFLVIDKIGYFFLIITHVPGINL